MCNENISEPDANYKDKTAIPKTQYRVFRAELTAKLTQNSADSFDSRVLMHWSPSFGRCCSVHKRPSSSSKYELKQANVHQRRQSMHVIVWPCLLRRIHKLYAHICLSLQFSTNIFKLWIHTLTHPDFFFRQLILLLLIVFFATSALAATKFGLLRHSDHSPRCQTSPAITTITTTTAVALMGFWPKHPTSQHCSCHCSAAGKFHGASSGLSAQNICTLIK